MTLNQKKEKCFIKIIKNENNQKNQNTFKSKIEKDITIDINLIQSEMKDMNIFILICYGKES